MPADGSVTHEVVLIAASLLVAAGIDHSLFLESDGSFWAMGANNDGQLRDGTRTNANKPEQVVSSGVIGVAAGFNHSLFIKSDGSLWAVGNDGFGQLGNGKYNSGTNLNSAMSSPIRRPHFIGRAVPAAGARLDIDSSSAMLAKPYEAFPHGYDSRWSDDCRRSLR